MRLKAQYHIWCLGLLTALLLSACAAVPPAPRKIALLAPFEGQYREIGYEALYAAQLALKEHDAEGQYLLLPLDDGGREATAKERVKALAYDDSIVFVLALGPYSTAIDVQAAYPQSLPILLVGWWPSLLPPQDLNTAALTANLREELFFMLMPYFTYGGPIGGELLSLPQFDGREDCVMWSSVPYADEAFISRYKIMNEFAPPPRLIAPLTYEAARIAIESLKADTPLREMHQNGDALFDDAGYWREGTPMQYGCGL